MLQPEKAGAVGDEKVLRIRHGRRAEDSVSRIAPRLGHGRFELDLIIGIRGQVRGIHPHHRLHRGCHRCGGRRRDAQGWRVRVADASSGDVDACDHAAGDVGNRGGIAAAPAHDVDGRTGDVAGAATGHRRADDKSIDHLRRGERLRGHWVERQSVISAVRHSWEIE